MLRFVTATRMDRRAFSARAPLCLSLGAAAQHGGLLVQAYPDNSSPLPTLYNQALDAAGADDVLVFAHDDLWVDDWWMARRLEEALAHFDVIGVAGNRRRQPGQCRWWWDDARAARDDPHLSGSVAHGKPTASKLTVYGPTPAEVRLLDGAFLAARASTLRRAQVRFDPRFSFDFYDLDFCRSCEGAGLRMGTWPIAVTHESVGQGIHGAAWAAARLRYLDKWGA